MIRHHAAVSRAIAFLVVLCAGPAWAQEGRIGGVVRDATGAIVPGVAVTASNQTSRASQTAITAADGSYSLAVPPGAYRVSATLSGFRIARVSSCAKPGLLLETGQ